MCMDAIASGALRQEPAGLASPVCLWWLANNWRLAKETSGTMQPAVSIGQLDADTLVKVAHQIRSPL